MGNATLTVAAGANVTGGAPKVVFGASTFNGPGVLNPTTADLALASITGVGQTVTLSGTSTNSTVGPITVANVIKNGSGKWITSGAGSVAGVLTVDAGTLLVNGSLAAAAGTTVNGGVLGGTDGTISALTVNAGGTIAPGASIGTLHTTDITLNADSVFALEINSTAQTSDLLDGTGALSLALTNDAILAVTDLNPSLITSGDFAFINYNGTWNSGLFEVNGQVIDDYDPLTNPNSTSFSIAGNTYQIDYNAGLGSNTVALHVVPEPNVLISLLGGTGLLLGLRRRRA
jgi:hypothetical protein